MNYGKQGDDELEMKLTREVQEHGGPSHGCPCHSCGSQRQLFGVHTRKPDCLMVRR